MACDDDVDEDDATEIKFDDSDAVARVPDAVDVKDV